ncbi:MAG: ATP-binding protein [Candidatus Latescibacterota bacterium]
MLDISLHILDIVENAVRADAGAIRIEITEDRDNDRFELRITDDGMGMDSETAEKIFDPFFTTKRGKKVGLGLSLLQQAAEQTGGKVTIDSKEGAGACVTAVFVPSHPDMKPLGNVFETVAVLTAGYPMLRLVYDYYDGENVIHYDSTQGMR